MFNVEGNQGWLGKGKKCTYEVIKENLARIILMCRAFEITLNSYEFFEF